MAKHETDDVDVRMVSLTGLGLVVAVLIVFGIVRVVFDLFASAEAKRTARAPSMSETSRQPPEPRLQINPARDLQQMRAVEDEVLNSYGWVDKPAGVVRIPVDRAMKLLAERGENPPSKQEETKPKDDRSGDE